MRRFACVLLLLAACGDDDSGPECVSSSDCSGAAVCVDGRCETREVDAGPPVDGGPPIDAGADAGPECDEPCEGECVGGVCCEAESVCGDACCGEGELCSFLRCVTPGESCRSADDCDAGEYCEPQLGESTMMCDGAPIVTGRCLPLPPRCDDGVEPDPAAPSCVTSCTFEPAAGDFVVEERFAWGSFDGDSAPPNLDDVRNSPIVIQLDDDDCDDRITGRDVPEIVVITSPDDSNRPDGTNPLGDLVALAVEGDALVEKWRVPAVANPWTYPAAGDFDGEPGNEVVVCNVSRDHALAYGVDDDGFTLLWESAELPVLCNMPVLADFDQDGSVEIAVGGTVLAGETGAIRFAVESPRARQIAYDVTGDGRLDLVDARYVHQLVGEAFVEIADLGVAAAHVLVADLEVGGLPELVSIDTPRHEMIVWRLDPAGGVEILREDLDINGTLDPTRCAESSTGRTRGGGPPTAADVNADGVPDIAVAGGVGYAVFDGADLVNPAVANEDTFFWVRDTVDCSSAQTGSSVFDFNGDGRAEVLYADEHTFRVYEGMTGTPLFEACSTNGTILELPVVADVDNDGQADVVVAANARYRECLDEPGTRVSGIRVYSSPRGDWVRTRRVWNQHPYHVTNVGEDGTIPRVEESNYEAEGLNNFRQNKQPGNELSAVDAVVTLAAACAGELGITATVRNLGEAVLPPGATVTLYRGTPGDTSDPVGTATTTRALFPAAAEDVFLATDDSDLLTGVTPVHAIVELPETVQECRTDNNTAEGLVRGCLI